MHACLLLVQILSCSTRTVGTLSRGQKYCTSQENNLCEYYHFLCIHQFRVRFVQLYKYDLFLIIIIGYSGFLFGHISRQPKKHL